MNDLDVTELDVKAILERAAGAPRAPFTDRTTMVALGQRARRRRAIGWVGSAVATIAVSAAVGLLAIGTGAHRGPVIQPGNGHPGPVASASPRPSHSPGPAAYDQAYGQRLLVTLSGLVPAGFTLPTEDLFTGPDGLQYQVRGVQAFPGPGSSSDGTSSFSPSVNAGTLVYRNGGQASLSVAAMPAVLPPDLCAAEIVHQGTEAGCRVDTATNGARIRVAWRDIAAYGRIWYATRYFADRSVTVQQSPNGIRPDLGAYGAVWDEAGLVEVAADPNFVP